MGEVNFVIRRLNEEKIFSAPQMCKECGGRCCKHLGCVFSPDDFYVLKHSFSNKERLQYLRHFLKRGYACIDHMELINRETGAYIIANESQEEIIDLEKLLNGEGALYIRMRNIGEQAVETGFPDLMDLFNLEKQCIGLRENGCRFSFKKRPKGGREIIPKFILGRAECSTVYDEYRAAMDWFPYQEILFQLWKELR